MMSRQKVLLYFAQNPYPGKTGTHKRCLDVIDAFLQMGFEVTLFSHVEYDPYYWDKQSIQHFTNKGVKVELYFSSQSDQLYTAHARQQNPEILNLDIHCPPGVVAQYRTLFNKLQPDIVFNFYVFSFGLLAGLDLSSCITVVDSIDLVSISGQLFEIMHASLGTPPYNPITTNPALLREDFFNAFHLDVNPEEFVLYDKFDCTLAISSNEAEQMRLATNKTDVTYLPITFPVAEIVNNFSSDPVFVGADNPFNIQAYLYFAKCVLPAVIDQEPLFNLRVIGALTKKLMAVPGVQMVGFVEDLRNVYADACFAVCPIIGGTGMSVKVVEAMAHGIPVIALRSSTQDTVITHGVNGFVANNAQEFIHYTTLLYKDRYLCAKMGRAARATINENFSSDLFMQTLTTLLGRHSHHKIRYHSDSGAEGSADGRELSNRINSGGPIIIDGVIFQLQPRGGGISRVWKEYLSRLTKLSIGPRLILLDRQGTAPVIDGLRTVTIDAYQEQTTGSRYRDAELLTRTCRALGASSLVSTYFTWAEGLPNALLIYDCVPEVLGWDMNTAQWQAKREAIARTNFFVAISKSSEKDFRKFYDPSREKKVDVIELSAAEIFQPASEHEIKDFLAHYRIETPYYLVCGHRWPHKNTVLFLKAISTLPDTSNYEILFTGGSQELEQEWLPYLEGVSWRRLDLSDRELAIAYSDAVALVYPSLYEGFGMPVLEAMRCGCPVITCHNSSIVEVAGDCVLYVGEHDVFGMTKALNQVRDQNVRETLISSGLEQAKLFSWDRSAELMESFLTTLSEPDAVKNSMIPSMAVSAIISTYNSEIFIRGCLVDLIEQTLYKKGQLEIIILDSASAQNEAEIIQELQAQYPNILYYRTETRESIYQSWNRAIRLASGRYVTNANTDDRHRFDALEQMAAVLDSNPDVALVYGDVFVSNFPNQTFDHHIRCGYQIRPDYAPEIMLSGCHMGPQPMWRRRIHDEIGFFSEKYLSAGDYEFWCRIARRYPLKHIPQFLGLYFENPEGFANSDTSLSRRETAMIQAEYAFDFPPPDQDYLKNLQFWRQEDYRGWANLCLVTRNNMVGLLETIESLVRLTEYPHTISVADRGSSDGTRDFMQSLKQRGIVTNLVLLDEAVTAAAALEAAQSCEPDASFQFEIDTHSKLFSPGWLTRRVESTGHSTSLGSALQETAEQQHSSCEKRPSLLFVMYGWKETGGGTVYPRAVARELVRRSYRVSVLYASLEEDPAKPACAVVRHQEDGITLFGMINRPARFTDPDNPQREINDPDVRAAFGRVLDEVTPDLVHFHNFHGLTFSLVEETFSRGIPSVLTPHNYHLIDPELYLLKHGVICWDDVDPLKESDAVNRNPHLTEWYRERIRTTLRVLNEWLSLTLAVSGRQRDLLIRYGADPARIAVIHQISPAADDLWNDPSLREKRLRPVKRPLQIGYTGGIVPIKGVQMLVAAAQAFNPDEIRVHLHGFGIADFLETLASQDRKGLVTFHGPYGPDDLRRIADELDLAVIPSIVEESAPTLVLTELLAMRVPVVAARIGGIPEFIADGVDGRLYPPNDLNALIEILRELIDNPDCLATMRRSLTAPTHTFASYMEQIEKVYADICAGAVPDAARLSLTARHREKATRDLPGISWQGGLFTNHSLAHVNRELCLQLLDRGYRISFTPSEPDDFSPSVDHRFNRLEAIRSLPLDSVDITIRHQWPPDFTPPDTGHWVMIQPWEFGSLLKNWIEPMNTQVDEVWVPSSYVRECYISSGVDKERVQVVPNGVDTSLFNPDAQPLPLTTRKKFRFLFVGGTIHRKGVDILLGAYHQAFTTADDVCLVIKDIGGTTVYEGRTSREVIERFKDNPGAPEIEYIDSDLTPAEMAGLYTACHCLVHPYRGEGFGLPIAEAMACGLAPIVTGYGAALDFCPPEIAWLIPATVEKLPLKQVGGRETVDYPWLAEPDFYALRDLMRYAAVNPDEVSLRGKAACRHIREHFTWEHAARKVEERICAIMQKPPKRENCSTPETANDTVGFVSPDESALRDRLARDACEKAETAAQRGDIEKAIALLINQGIKAAPALPAPYVKLADLLLSAKRYEDALQVVPEMPVGTDAALKSEIEAICHAATGNDDAARRAAQRSGERPKALVVLGTLAARQGDLQTAEREFRRAIDKDPSCGNAWLSLGMLMWTQGRHEEAWQAVFRAVTVDPLRNDAAAILKDMAERLGRLPDALRLVEESAQQYPDSIALARLRTDLLGENGLQREALEACLSFLLRFGNDEGILERASALRSAAGPHDLLAEGGPGSISLCMIVRDEEQCLARCLASCKPLVHEMVVVDTGSTDRTRAIAHVFGARVTDFPWNDNFSDARNRAIEQARGAWILVLDADEALSKRDYELVAQTLENSAGRMVAWSVTTRNYTNRTESEGWLPNDGKYGEREEGDGWYPSRKVRLFPAAASIRFHGDVHEMVEPDLRHLGIPIEPADFVVHHYGELEEKDRKAKQLRYYEMGKAKLAGRPDDRAAVAELALQAGQLGFFEEALEYWDRLLASGAAVRDVFFNRSYALMGLHRYVEALASAEKALELDSNHKESQLNAAICELHTGNQENAWQRVGRLAEKHREWPLLTALMLALAVISGEHRIATDCHAALSRQGYGVGSYIEGLQHSLISVGQPVLAGQLAIWAKETGCGSGK